MGARRKYNHEFIWKLYETGYTDFQIAEAVGCSTEYIKNLRGEKRLPPNPELFDEGKMMDLHRAHWSIHKIADEMGVEDEEIERRLRDVTRQH